MLSDVEFIYVFSVQHTGTWFVNNLLLRHSHVKKCLVYPDDMKGPEGLRPIEDVLAEHEITEGKVIICTHVWPDSNEQITAGLRETMGEHFKDSFLQQRTTVMPVRDPLRSMVTRKIRHPELPDHGYIVHSFLDLIKANAHFLPIDTGQSSLQRMGVVRDLFSYCGLKNEGFFHEVASAWEPQNKSTPDDHPLVRAYNDRKISKLVEALPNEWRLLHGYRTEIRPFMERQGYERLLWWG